jgi:hypothetical protein
MSYEAYQQLKKDHAERNADLISKVKRDEVPQNILMAKTVSNILDDGEKCTTGNNLEFGFTERMVNKLMHYAFLLGATGVDERSFERGYEKAREEMAKFLGCDDYED